MIESQYTANIHKKLPKNVYKWKINDNFAGGVPDAFYRGLGGEGKEPLWVEYKFLKSLPKRDETVIVPNLSEQQLLWLSQAIGAREYALVIVGVADEKVQNQTAGFVMHPHEWRKGISTKVARTRLKSYDQIAADITTIVLKRRT